MSNHLIEKFDSVKMTVIKNVAGSCPPRPSKLQYTMLEPIATSYWLSPYCVVCRVVQGCVLPGGFHFKVDIHEWGKLHRPGPRPPLEYWFQGASQTRHRQGPGASQPHLTCNTSTAGNLTQSLHETNIPSGTPSNSRRPKFTCHYTQQVEHK